MPHYAVHWREIQPDAFVVRVNNKYKTIIVTGTRYTDTDAQSTFTCGAATNASYVRRHFAVLLDKEMDEGMVGYWYNKTSEGFDEQNYDYPNYDNNYDDRIIAPQQNLQHPHQYRYGRTCLQNQI